MQACRKKQDLKYSMLVTLLKKKKKQGCGRNIVHRMFEQSTNTQLEMLRKTDSAEKTAFGFAFLYIRKNCKHQGHSTCAFI